MQEARKNPTLEKNRRLLNWDECPCQGHAVAQSRAGGTWKVLTGFQTAFRSQNHPKKIPRSLRNDFKEIQPPDLISLWHFRNVLLIGYRHGDTSGKYTNQLTWISMEIPKIKFQASVDRWGTLQTHYIAILSNATSWPKKTWDGLTQSLGERRSITQSWTPRVYYCLLAKINIWSRPHRLSQYIPVTTACRPTHHPPQGCSVAASLASTQHRATAKKRATARSQIWWREDAKSSPTAASQRREDAKGRRAPPAASQLRSVAKMRGAPQGRRSVAKTWRREGTPATWQRHSVAASQCREDVRSPQRQSAAWQRRTVAKSRRHETVHKPSRSVAALRHRRESSLAALQRLTASEPTWRTHCVVGNVMSVSDRRKFRRQTSDNVTDEKQRSEESEKRREEKKRRKKIKKRVSEERRSRCAKR